MAVHVVHSTAPTCHWSWGYEAVMNRLRMVYGDQIQLHVRLGCPYEDRDQWLVDYGMSAKEAEDWINAEVGDTMEVALAPVSWSTQPKSGMPATLAVQAAMRQGEGLAWKLNRALVRRYAIEAKDPTTESEILAAAKEVGLDTARLRKDVADVDGLRAEYEAQGTRGPQVHAGFYNFIVTDDERRRVILDYAFEPADVEGAIDYISGGTLTKRPVGTDIVGYLREHGWAPLSEIGRVFDLDGRGATDALEKLEKTGKIERGTFAGAPHWRAM